MRVLGYEEADYAYIGGVAYTGEEADLLATGHVVKFPPSEFTVLDVRGLGSRMSMDEQIWLAAEENWYIKSGHPNEFGLDRRDTRLLIKAIKECIRTRNDPGVHEVVDLVHNTTFPKEFIGFSPRKLADNSSLGAMQILNSMRSILRTPVLVHKVKHLVN